MLPAVRLPKLHPPLPALEKFSVAQDLVHPNLVEDETINALSIEFLQAWQNAIRQCVAGQLQCFSG